MLGSAIGFLPHLVHYVATLIAVLPLHPREEPAFFLLVGAEVNGFAPVRLKPLFQRGSRRICQPTFLDDQD
jgi:hypothetical protein